MGLVRDSITFRSSPINGEATTSSVIVRVKVLSTVAVRFSLECWSIQAIIHGTDVAAVNGN